MVSIMNGIRLGGGFMMAPQGEPEYGVFDLCIAKQVSRPQIFSLIGRFMQGTQASHEAILTARTSKINVTAVDGALPAHADGETLCVEGTQLSVELLPRQIELIHSPAKT
jgi:diacylglycerol kinase family enzyme